MKNLSKKDLLLVSLMLFSLFFGAGNLIFPPFLGQSAGNATWVAMAGFFITAVGFPILGVVAVAKSDGLYNLSKRVNPLFAVVFTALIYYQLVLDLEYQELEAYLLKWQYHLIFQKEYQKL